MRQNQVEARMVAWGAIGLIKGPDVLRLTRDEIPNVLGQLCKKCRGGVNALADSATNINWVTSFEVVCSACRTRTLAQIIPDRKEVLARVGANSVTPENHLSLEAVS